MSNISTTRSAARTDVRLPHGSEQATTSATRRAGLALAAGALAWSVSSFVVGFNPTHEVGIKVQDLTGLAFQVGVMALLHVQMRTQATGTKRLSARLLGLERVLLVVAMAWSVTHALMPGQRDAVWMHVLDVFWPLSMLGMFFIGIKVAVKGRWRGPARIWSLLAETWAPVTVPIIGIAGQAAGDVVGATHLLLGYTTLGLILAIKPELVEPRD